ncbi:MAG: hypothetical protein CMH63_02510 [Nanoarchaeota archaeon]|jgi:hypothetical protein|nr:hypothetical protein [Nanoarchaeota archaeon]|tara:strand:- start:4462 stop:4797 length:336 start_codon:yes stop_codon:yes gene_type:complete
MKKEKILGLSNNEDSHWFKLQGTDQALKHLDKIFDTSDLWTYWFHELEKEDTGSYNWLVQNSPLDFTSDEKDYLVYFIFTTSTIHLILRRVRKFEKYKKEILKHFEFKKRK